MNEYGFFSKDVALKLDINASTLRQWCLAMEKEEKEGYEFQRWFHFIQKNYVKC
jgi:hypothetical protein